MLGFTWYCVGALSVGAVWVMLELSKRYELSVLAWALALGGVATTLFAVAWTAGSIVEGEPQAAAMGATIFGGLGIANVALTWRLLIAPSPRRQPPQ